ncbi:ABC transporter permease [Taylorella equigenitalis]|uniref:Histidine ABC transporter, permease protein HisQ n=2 Tax=Taylorella equigenitalis TaxID=29575 RepID=A0A654KHD5_TAYEM|nr:ABC transporter permease subunit [Taylorella equigenitalis]ADU91841.1 Histidine ABC transporter, permease protein HisQ [Taylorella equigenitalis MCE9]AFN35406.1 putative polar amino acid ABC transporter, inner membrane subunit [Taylorella equigenitalis ATCC 35865]ASY30064.1 amino acid ABC transporter permease [Taylorella equigenitalis]ASY37369.1 amino acid ABC transporter permease [Taylorella equigenitalis]ASY38836.1 amino acid ABC transporter permease [Taylorella equigenitalis]
MSDFDVFLDYLPRVLEGALVTLEVALLSVILAVVIGFIGALFRLSKNRIISFIGTFYSTFVRGVPDIVWMLMIFYSIQIGLNQVTEYFDWDYIEISPFFAGVLTLSFIYGAFFTETFRGAILAIPKGSIEAGEAYGMSKMQVSSRIIFPLMMRFAIPGMKNNWLVLNKATALVSLIGLEDMTLIAHNAGSATHLSFAFNLLSALIFLIASWLSLSLFKYLEVHYSRGVLKGVEV